MLLNTVMKSHNLLYKTLSSTYVHNIEHMHTPTHMHTARTQTHAQNLIHIQSKRVCTHYKVPVVQIRITLQMLCLLVATGDQIVSEVVKLVH